MSEYKSYLSIERNWIPVVDGNQCMPPIGEQVDVKTIFEHEDVGIWNGKEWVDDFGKWRGARNEVIEWRFIRK